MPAFLEKIAHKSGVELTTIHKFLREMSASPRCEAFDVAISRYLSVVLWFKEVLHLELLEPEDLESLVKLKETESRWLPDVPQFAPSRMNSNTPVASIGAYPLYALLTAYVRRGNENLEELLVPLISAFYLLNDAQNYRPSYYQKASSSIRKLFMFSRTENKKLSNLATDSRWDGKRKTLILMYLNYRDELAWVRAAREILRIKVPKLRRLSQGPECESTRQTTRESGHRKQRPSVHIERAPFWQPEDIEPEGLSNDESGAREEHLVFEKAANIEPELAHRRFHAFSEMDNQYLRGIWSHFREQEIEWLCSELEGLLTSGDELGLVLALSLSTSRSIEEVLRFQLSFQAFDEHKQYQDITIFPKHGYWSHPKFQPEQAFSPTDEHYPYLQKTQQFVLLNFPDKLRNRLEHYFSGGSDIRIRDVVGDCDEITEKAESWIKASRNSSGFRRFTLVRIRDWAMYEMLSTTQDPALCSQIFWIDAASSASVYYANFDGEQLQKNYSAILSQVLGETSSSLHISYCVGSELKLASNVIAHLVDDLTSKLSAAKALKGIERFVEVHNRLTTYVITMLLHETGHRPVSDLFEKVNGLDIDARIHFIADKVDGDSDHGRIVWLSESAVQQLEAYRKHLNVLSSYLIELDVELARRIECVVNQSEEGGLPQFFYLKRDKGKPPIPQQITPSRLKSELGINVPLNCFRHHLTTRLRQLNVPAEFINYQLDHMKYGQEFDGLYSTLSVLDITKELSPALQKISEAVGFVVQHGLPRAKTRAIKARNRHEQRYWLFGSQQRAKRRRDDRKKLHKVIQSCLDSVKAGQVDKDWLEEVDAYLMASLSTSVEIARAKKLIHRKFKNQNKDAATCFRLFWDISMPVRKSSCHIRLSHAGQLRQARQTRESLYRWLMTASTKTTLDELSAMFVASAVMNGGLVQEEKVHNLRVEFNQCQRFEGVVWFDFDENAFVPSAIRRWFLDVITIRLIELLLKKQSEHKALPRRRTLNTFLKRKLRVNNLEQLIQQSVRLMSIELPAVVMHYAVGNIVSASLNEESLLRVLSGKGVTKTGSKGETITIRPYTISQPNHTQDLDFEFSMKLRHSIGRVFRDKSLSKAQRITMLNDLAERHQADVSPICIAHIQWLCQILAYGRTKEIKLATAANYQANSTKCLFQACWHIRTVNDLEETDFSGLYDETLSYVTDRNKPLVASLLSHFHQSLVDNWNVPDIDFSQIEPRAIGRSVRPNLITEDEFQKIRASLQPPHRMLIDLQYRGRLRGKELKALDIKDIHICEQSINLNIRSTAKNTTKSLAGIRVFPYSEYAPEQEVTPLCVFVNGQKRGRVGELFPETCWDEIGNTLRNITVENDVVLYDMRHSGVSLAVLRELENHDCAIDVLIGSKIYSDGSKNNICCSQRARLYHEALITGHASPSTTTSFYCHTLDLILLSQMTARISIPWGSNPSSFFGIDTNHLNYLKRNYASSFLFMLQNESANDSLINDVTKSVSFVETASYEKPQKEIDLFSIMEVLNQSAHGKELFYTTLSVGLEPEVVELVISIARQLEKQSGYEINRVFRAPHSWQEWRGNEYLEQLQTQHDNTELMSFLSRYNPNYEALFFDNEAELSLWLAFISTLVGTDSIRLLVSDNHPEYKTPNDIRELLILLGVGEYKFLTKTVQARTNNYKSEPGIGLTVSGDCDSHGRYSLNTLLLRGIFAGCVLHEVKMQLAR